MRARMCACVCARVCVCVCICVCITVVCVWFIAVQEMYVVDKGGGYGLWQASCLSSLCVYQIRPLSIPDLTLVWSAMFLEAPSFIVLLHSGILHLALQLSVAFGMWNELFTMLTQSLKCKLQLANSIRSYTRKLK